MLTARVRVRAIEREGSQHRAAHRPAPGPRYRNRQRQRTHGQHSESRHLSSLVAYIENEATVARLSIRCQYWLQSTTVELVARRAREARDEVRRSAARDTGLDELRHGRNGLVRCSRPCRPRDAAEDERDLPLRRLGEMLRHLRCRAAHYLLEPLRQLTADRDRPLRLNGRERTQRRR